MRGRRDKRSRLRAGCYFFLLVSVLTPMPGAAIEGNPGEPHIYTGMEPENDPNQPACSQYENTAYCADAIERESALGQPGVCCRCMDIEGNYLGESCTFL
ncbi:MAG: hypothetical protein DCC75_04115 [Proteobacteria bacterium]|nr:MAG: hypothetical protein DCC75_04115 [Pseudomonadota bacterium]